MSSGGNRTSFAMVLPASVGDYFELEVYQTSSGNLNFEPNVYISRFEATYLGA